MRCGEDPARGVESATGLPQEMHSVGHHVQSSHGTLHLVLGFRVLRSDIEPYLALPVHLGRLPWDRTAEAARYFPSIALCCHVSPGLEVIRHVLGAFHLALRQQPEGT